MKFTCDRSALVDKLGVLSRGVSTRSALPVLSGILLQAGEDRLDLFSTDMELSIKANVATPVEREGEIVVPARLFSDVVRNLPDEDVVIGSRFVLPDGLDAFEKLDEVTPRPGNRAVGEERAWGRRLAKAGWR